MITIEVRENTQSNYLKLWCQTCRRTLELLDYGLEDVAPGMIDQLQGVATNHERHNHKHSIYIYEGKRPKQI